MGQPAFLFTLLLTVIGDMHAAVPQDGLLVVFHCVSVRLYSSSNNNSNSSNSTTVVATIATAVVLYQTMQSKTSAVLW